MENYEDRENLMNTTIIMAELFGIEDKYIRGAYLQARKDFDSKHPITSRCLANNNYARELYGGILI